MEAHHQLAESPYHFSALRHFMPDISPKVLTEQLGELIADDIVAREETEPVPAPVMYSLTSYGLSILPLLEQVKIWGRDHVKHFSD